MGKLMDTLDLLAQGDDFAFHVAMYAAFLAYRDAELDLQDLSREPRFYDWLFRNKDRIAKTESFARICKIAQWEDQWESASHPQSS